MEDIQNTPSEAQNGRLLAQGYIAGKLSTYQRASAAGAFKTANRLKYYRRTRDKIATDIILNFVETQHGEAMARRAALSLNACRTIKHAFTTLPIIDVPICFALCTYFPRIVRGPATGELPGNGGDFDNYVKGFMDSMVYHGVIKDDNPKWYRGTPHHTQLAQLDWVPGVKEGPRGFHWAVFQSIDP